MRILVAGPPAAGKSTLAEQIASVSGAEVVDFDLIAKELGSPDDHDHPADVRGKAGVEFDRRLAALTGPAVVVRSAPTVEERSQIADRIGADSVIVLDTPADEAKRRAKSDDRPSWTADAIDRWWSAYEPESTRHSAGQRVRPALNRTEEGATVPDDHKPTPDDNPGGRTLTQADIDRIVEDRLKRERAKFSDYDDLKAKAEKLAEIENANRSDAEKLSEKIAAAEKRAADAEARAVRLEVATEKGLTPAQAKRLVGSTREELEADASEILEAFPSQQTPAAPPSEKPAPSLKGGSDPTEEPDVDIRKVVDSIPRWG